MEAGADKKGKGPEADEPKVFVKSDQAWKEEAQKEKERLAQQAEAEAEAARRSLPKPTFAGFVGELGMQALLTLGLLELEGQPKPPRDLPAARYTIDLLDLLQEKTRGNLAPEEKRHVDELIHSLHIQYARVAQEEAAASKKIKEPEKKIIT